MSQVFGTDPRLLARTYDPDTSHLAAAAVNTETLEEMVYREIKAYGDRGCISDEIRVRHLDMPYSSITARFAALISKGLIVDTGERRPGTAGRKQRVMMANPYPVGGQA